MKITDIQVFLAKEWRTFLFVRIETDAGFHGVGEAGFTGRELAVAGAIEHFKPLLIGEDPRRTEHLWQMLSRGGFYPGGALLSCAVAAIDIALWDIKAKALGVPVFELLGGRVRDSVLTYTHIHGTSSDELLSSAVRAVDEGWQCLRWEPAYNADGTLEPQRSVDRAISEFALLRETLGEGVKLCFDAHTKWGVSDAVRFCRAVEKFHPLFIEDPIRSENPISYRRLRNQTSVPIAAGEQFGSKWEFRQLVEEELIDYSRIDLCIAGGLTEGKKIAAMCETHLIDVAVHNPIGPIATAAALHFNIAVSNFGVMELPKRPGETMPDAFNSGFEWHKGSLLPPSAPGLGIDFDPDALKAYSFEVTELPHIRRTDGTFSNW